MGSKWSSSKHVTSLLGPLRIMLVENFIGIGYASAADLDGVRVMLFAHLAERLEPFNEVSTLNENRAAAFCELFRAHEGPDRWTEVYDACTVYLDACHAHGLETPSRVATAIVSIIHSLDAVDSWLRTGYLKADGSTEYSLESFERNLALYVMIANHLRRRATTKALLDLLQHEVCNHWNQLHSKSLGIYSRYWKTQDVEAELRRTSVAVADLIVFVSRNYLSVSTHSDVLIQQHQGLTCGLLLLGVLLTRLFERSGYPEHTKYVQSIYVTVHDIHHMLAKLLATMETKRPGKFIEDALLVGIDPKLPYKFKFKVGKKYQELIARMALFMEAISRRKPVSEAEPADRDMQMDDGGAPTHAGASDDTSDHSSSGETSSPGDASSYGETSSHGGTAPAIDGAECHVCMDLQRTHALVPCGHLALCGTCADYLIARNRPCPICRSPASSALRVFTS
jgi:Zinc finger, C3HC4 type (RING finger)